MFFSQLYDCDIYKQWIIFVFNRCVIYTAFVVASNVSVILVHNCCFIVIYNMTFEKAD